VILGLLVLAWKVRHTEPLVGFGLFLFFLSLGPVSNIVPIRAIINERFLYLGCAGFGMIAGRALGRLRHRGWFAAALVLVGLYGAVSARRNLDWKDPLSMPPPSKAKTVLELVSGEVARVTPGRSPWGDDELPWPPGPAPGAGATVARTRGAGASVAATAEPTP